MREKQYLFLFFVICSLGSIIREMKYFHKYVVQTASLRVFREVFHNVDLSAVCVTVFLLY